MPAGSEFYNDAYRAYNEKLISVYDVKYNESVWVGYRWYDSKGIRPLYPFGFGLSYTTFALSKPRIRVSHDSAKVQVTLTNTGQRKGSEVVQLYISTKDSAVPRPDKELKAFRKVELQAGEKTLLEFELNKKDLAFWDVTSHNWKVNPGEYIIKIGTSSADIAHSLSWTIK